MVDETDEYIKKQDAIAALWYNQDECGSAIVPDIEAIPAADVAPVVFCKDCEWWEKQVDSAQGRCMRLGIYPTGGWFCANGNQEVDDGS